jgi:hypothetical protein
MLLLLLPLPLEMHVVLLHHMFGTAPAWASHPAA